MRSRSRRRGLEEHEDSHPDERWMASYMDMVTVLMCMFIVLFAMSSLDKEKFEQLRDSLAVGFGATEVIEKVVAPPKVEKPDETITDIELARMEVDSLIALREAIRTDLEKKGLSHMVEFQLDERGLTIRLIGSETFFAPNSTDLSGQTRQVLDAIGPVLARTAYPVSVEGHADYRGSSFPYPTDWELSAGRATQVLRHLVEQGGVAPERIAAVGFGSARPATTGSSPKELALNRRVDVAVLSSQPESVRALIPEVLANF